MKEFIEALGLSGPERDYLFHLVGHFGAYEFGKMSEEEFSDERAKMIFDDDREKWAKKGVAYRIQDIIFEQYKEYSKHQKEGGKLEDYVKDNRISLMADRSIMNQEKVNFKTLKKKRESPIN